MHDEAVLCVKCGCAVENIQVPGTAAVDPDASPKSGITALLLCFFLGGLGIHRFYVGKIGTGVIQLLTLGLCGIWTLIAFILILPGSFT
ncbi:MAG: TM2 domain-containing protein, partial [Rikenella sp.]|nr:TM2 domain-containing protein [Rikenella sp.]